MNRKLYISAGFLTLLLLVIIFGLLRLGGNDSPKESDESTNVDSKQYSKKQYKQAESRSNSQEELDTKVQEYIENTNAPKSQSDYDKAIKMRSPETQKNLKRNVKDMVSDKKRSVDNLSTYIDYENKDKLTGTYDCTVSYTKDSKIESENKSGEFTIKTNKDGYFYIDQIN